MNIRPFPHRVGSALVAIALFMAPLAGHAANSISAPNWAPIFQGIDLTSITFSNGVDSSAAVAARVDLSASGISFTTSEQRGTLDATVETVSSFLERKDAQLAINTGFFTPCCTTADVDIRGLAVSNGTIVSPRSAATADNSVGFVTVLGQNNSARIGTIAEVFGTGVRNVTTQEQINAAGVWNAFSGSGIIVRNGQNVGASHGTFGSPTTVNPRTVVGLSQDARWLYLVAIDGRQAGYSTGVVMTEAADLMLGLGAWTAMNADGGGSTTLVRDDGLGHAQLLNLPSNTGNAQRLVSNSLAIYALPVPEPAAWLLWSVGLMLMALVRVRHGH